MSDAIKKVEVLDPGQCDLWGLIRKNTWDIASRISDDPIKLLETIADGRPKLLSIFGLPIDKPEDSSTEAK